MQDIMTLHNLYTMYLRLREVEQQPRYEYASNTGLRRVVLMSELAEIVNGQDGNYIVHVETGGTNGKQN